MFNQKCKRKYRATNLRNCIQEMIFVKLNVLMRYPQKIEILRFRFCFRRINTEKEKFRSDLFTLYSLHEKLLTINKKHCFKKLNNYYSENFFGFGKYTKHAKIAKNFSNKCTRKNYLIFNFSFAFHFKGQHLM